MNERPFKTGPMISAVMAILFGQALLLNSLCHLAWATFFSLGNMLYISPSEEPASSGVVAKSTGFTKNTCRAGCPACGRGGRSGGVPVTGLGKQAGRSAVQAFA